MKCQDCQYWTRNIIYKFVNPLIINKEHNERIYTFSYHNENCPGNHKLLLSVIRSRFGRCSNCRKFVHTRSSVGIEDNDLGGHDSDSLLYSGDEKYDAYLLTAENFGCVHFSIKS